MQNKWNIIFEILYLTYVMNSQSQYFATSFHLLVSRITTLTLSIFNITVILEFLQSCRFYGTTVKFWERGASWSSVIICYRVIPRKPVHNRSRHSLNIWNNSFWQSWWFLTLMMMHIVQLSARSLYPYVELRNSFRPPRWYHSKTRSQTHFHKEIWSLGLPNSKKNWGFTILADLG